MIKDKKEKKDVLKELMKQMSSRVADNDLKPKLDDEEIELPEKKTGMVIKAEGDSPEQIKEDVIEKLGKMDLPDEEDMEEIEEKFSGHKEEEEEDDDDDFMNELPESLKKALMKKLNK